MSITKIRIMTSSPFGKNIKYIYFQMYPTFGDMFKLILARVIILDTFHKIDLNRLNIVSVLLDFFLS